jgi:hypothetical protein
MAQEILHNIRKKLAGLNKIEITAKEDQPALQDMWDKLQDLREEICYYLTNGLRVTSYTQKVCMD